MKKNRILIAAALSLALVFALAGCGATQSTAGNGSSLLSPVAAPGNQVLADVAGSDSDYLTGEEAKQIAL